MIKKIKILKIRRPDDWHVHLRDGNILNTVLPYTSKYFGRAIIMPNLEIPITTIKQAIKYRKKILSIIPSNHNFKPLMTCYLTNNTKKDTIINGYNSGVFTAAKLYPYNSTTNSNYGINNINDIYPILEIMQNIKMPLLIHAEINNDKIDIFDREAVFIKKIMKLIRNKFPFLKIIIEHITTKEAVNYIINGDKYLAATITPQHLIFNRNDIFINSLKSHLYCLPIYKSIKHQNALRKAICSNCNRFFLGTDTAPHIRSNKESSSVKAGVFSAPTALSIYASVFEEMNALKNFESFCSLNGPAFYNLPINKDHIELHKISYLQKDKIKVINENNEIVPLLYKKKIKWTVIPNNLKSN